MAKWWGVKKTEDAPAPEPEPEYQEEETDPWAGYTADEDEEDEPTQGAGDDVPATKLEAALAERAEYLRQKFAEKGIDISDDGEPVIRDPKKFRGWASPAVTTAVQETRRADPPAPEPAPAPAPVRQESDEKEVWELTRADLDRMIEEKARALAQPVIDRLQQTQSMVGKRWVDEATQKAADALAHYFPEYQHIIEHPDFEQTYKAQLANLNPEFLDSPQVLATTAVGLAAWLDPEQMPQRKQPVDDKMARAAVNRSMVPNSRPELAQASTATARAGFGPTDEYQIASRWLAEKRIARLPAEELMALDAVDEYGNHTIEAYEKAKRKMAKARGGAR